MENKRTQFLVNCGINTKNRPYVNVVKENCMSTTFVNKDGNLGINLT